MNEVSKIHLGRQAFTISADAHKDLRLYLDAIKKEVQDESVAQEVELRIAELLAEHGITGDKVVLPADITFIKEQLGAPKDFREDSDDGGNAEPASSRPAESKRLFRDTEAGMLAGVAAGLAAYTGIDVWLVRILFVIGIFTGGWGILLYLVLWLLVPEAKTTSDRLQMVGKPVTIHSLKEVIDRADVKGAAERANNSLTGPINSFFRAILKIAGIVLIVVGISSIFALITGESYIIFRHGLVTQDNIFPVGFKEHLLVNVAVIIAAIISVFIILSGMALFRHKWPIRTWITGILVGLLFLSFAAGAALTADVVPAVRDRYNANFHYALRTTPAFSTVTTIGDVNIDYQSASTYSVVIRSFGSTNVSGITTTVKDGTLQIDSTRLNQYAPCHVLCIPRHDNVTITVRAPSVPVFPSPEKSVPDMPIKPWPLENQ
jgi:phage shock protein PspC (stress-responsive transcriptional regulator)